VASTDAGASWHDAGSLTEPARYPAVAVQGGAIYLFGGVATAGGSDTTAIQRYDPASRTATVVAHLPAPLSHATAVPFGRVVFVVGGYVNDVPSNQILRFDPATATVTAVGSLPQPLTDAGAAVIGGVGYLVGGEGPGRSTTAAVEVLTPR
jgi:N-acetylneuraminic acid mutarotase